MNRIIAFRGMLALLSLVLVTGSCKKNSTPSSPGPIRDSTPDLQMVAQGMVSPVALAEPPDSTHRLFVVDQTGKIWIIGSDGKQSATPFLDLSSKMVALTPSYDERGLLGLAFHPQFKSNEALREAMGYILGMGYAFKAKPDAFASSCCADKMVN